MNTINPTELLKTIKTLMFEHDFFIDDINAIDEYTANRIATSILSVVGKKKFIETLKLMGYKQEIKTYNIIKGDTNDGKLNEYKLTGTYSDAKEFIETDLIGKNALRNWEINDNIYSYFYNEDECIYFEIVIE